MVVMAYVAGVCTPVAAVLGVVGGMRWWRALRRAEGHTDGPLILTPVPPPPPPLPAQDLPTVNRISLANRPGPNRSVRGKRRNTG